MSRIRFRVVVLVLSMTCASVASIGSEQAGNQWLPYSPTGYYLYLLNCCGPIADWPNVRLDSGGIPMVTYDGGSTYQYYPITVALFGLQGYSWHLKYGNPEFLESATRAADWLVHHQDPETGQWLARFNYYAVTAGVTLRDPWGSSMAQGLSMSLLTRMYIRTGERKYFKAAVAALAPLRKSVKKGGLVDKFHRHPFYEEYPTDPPIYTLNGFMYTLIGLYDLRAIAPDSDAGALYEQGLTTLKFALPYYDLSTTSAYALSHITNPIRPVYTIRAYHQIHVMLLRALDSVTPDPTLSYYAALWATYPACADTTICDP